MPPAHIKPYQLADDWDESRREVLETCLRATRVGLLDLQWELLCPLCRGSQGGNGSLADLDSKAHCDTCRIDFTVNFDRFVELTFRPNDSIRATRRAGLLHRQSAADAARRRAAIVAGAFERELDLPLEVGNYRLRALNFQATCR